ncbi:MULTISPECIES: MIP/aquaporin family protein [Marinilactibacillus]|uniref:MIP/aquaporin family protein n=2 Tax=Marinilactibacillus TaxID=191769 RepID=A0ABW8UKI4_9LACT|nr:MULTISPECIES: MIP/aquaporin family protein [Marinilactibacillus]API87983.1 aquaporin [Marinilactibacillus sp. 15R]SFK35118.1 glycerol uptake facilitator protein [Marinilactibacillus piezotolerans]
MDTTLWQQLIGEFFGTMILVLLGDGVVAANVLKKTKSADTGWLLITIGWGLGVTMAVYAVGWLSPAHINPAVTLGMAIAGEIAWASVIPYMIAQVAGGIVGATLVWLHYMPHFAATDDQEAILAVFSTGPAIRHSIWNLVSETIATTVLVYGLLAFTQGEFTEGLNPVVVGLLIVAIGISLGGTTGYAINPARDLGPRIAHQILPIANKGTSDWGYAWIPIVGPFLGAIVGSLLFMLISS